jgi:hypothetical protein
MNKDKLIEMNEKRIQSRIPRVGILNMNVSDHLANLVNFCTIYSALGNYEMFERRNEEIYYYSDMRDIHKAKKIGDVLRIAGNIDEIEEGDAVSRLYDCYFNFVPEQFNFEHREE